MAREPLAIPQLVVAAAVFAALACVGLALTALAYLLLGDAWGVFTIWGPGYRDGSFVEFLLDLLTLALAALALALSFLCARGAYRRLLHRP